MTVLVTGGAGYVGSHIVDALIKREEEVVVLDDLSIGKLENIQHHLGKPNLRFVQGDIRDREIVGRAMEDCAMVYHMAARVGIKYIVDDPLRGLLTNVIGSENVLSEAHKRGRKLLLASTSEIYGKSNKVPFSEDDDRILGPTTVARWSYSSAKAVDEHLTLAYAREGLSAVIVRYFNSYGPRLDSLGYGSVVAKFIVQALRGVPLTIHGTGQQTRSFTYVDDTVRGTLLAASNPAALGQVFNIGSFQEISIVGLAQNILRVTESPSPVTFIPYSDFFGPNFEDSPRRLPNPHKAKEILGFEAAVTLDEGLQKTVEWMKKTIEVAT
ncbi:MAG: GDP-mannose 4,6-dehydratase [Chloroflexi bacterium]|nr:GDP-mannose 4,6-dehydratase [Chloroflexota bacterium]